MDEGKRVMEVCGKSCWMSWVKEEEDEEEGSRRKEEEKRRERRG